MGLKDRPNTVVIGAGKCSTTSMAYTLNRHPDACMATRKELNYFSHDKNYALGKSWYEEQFINCKNKKCRFEASPSYAACSEFPEVAKRMHAYNKEFKLIYIVRDPFARMYSHFRHSSVVFPQLFKSLDFVLSNKKLLENLINRSCYMQQIESYLNYFSQEKIHIVFLEEIISGGPVINGVLDFLELSVLEMKYPKTNDAKSRDYSGVEEVTKDEFIRRIPSEVRERVVLDSDRLGKFLGKEKLPWSYTV